PYFNLPGVRFANHDRWRGNANDAVTLSTLRGQCQATSHRNARSAKAMHSKNAESSDVRRCLLTVSSLSRVKRQSRRFPKEQTFRHNVYVILLGDAVAKHPSILRLNPNRNPLKPCVYVGMTGLPVDHRF